MKLKKTNKNSNLPVDEQGYKKAYLQRLLEEAESKKELEQWKKTNHDKTLANREAD